MKVRFKSILLAGAAIVFVGNQAFAADPMPAPVASWTGFYVGIGGGGAFGFSNTDATGYGAFLGVSEDSGRINSEDYDFVFDSDGDQFGSGFLDCGEDIGGGNDNLCAAGFANQVNIGNGSSSGETPELLTELFTELNNLVNTGDGGDNDAGVAGAFGTIEGGFDYQVGSNFLVGLNGAFNLGNSSIENSASSLGASVLADIDLPNNSTADNGSISVAAIAGGGTLDTELDLGNSWSIGGRAGYLVSENILLFAAGGYISTKAELKASYKASGGGLNLSDGPGGGGNNSIIAAGADLEASSSKDEWMNGYYVGGGVETLLSENVSFKLEYRYADLGSIETSVDYEDVDDFYTNAIGFAAAGVAAEADPVVHSIRATVNWRF